MAKDRSLDDIEAAIAVANATATTAAHSVGIPYFEADNCFVYAVYPDVIGGANGAGKSTLAYVHIPDLISAGRFLNADEIAKQLAPEDQQRAAIAAGRSIVRARRGV